MAVVITELLGTDPFSGSRITINANFASLANEVNDLEAVFGISLSSGNMDLTANVSGGVIKANSVLVNNTIQMPATGVPNVTITGSTGDIQAETMELSTSASIPTLSVNNLTTSSLGSSVFNGQATFNKLLLIRDGWALNKVNIGAQSTHTVINDDNVVLFQPTGVSPDSLTLTADAALVDGHVVHARGHEHIRVQQHRLRGRRIQEHHHADVQPRGRQVDSPLEHRHDIIVNKQ
jgi:hypothetical protein